MLGLVAATGWLVVPGAVAIGTGAGLGLLSSAVHIGHVAPDDRRAEVYSAYLVALHASIAGFYAVPMGHEEDLSVTFRP